MYNIKKNMKQRVCKREGSWLYPSVNNQRIEKWINALCVKRTPCQTWNTPFPNVPHLYQFIRDVDRVLFVTSQLTLTPPKNTPCSSDVGVAAVMYRDRMSYVHVHMAASMIAKSRGSPDYPQRTAIVSIHSAAHQ